MRHSHHKEEEKLNREKRAYHRLKQRKADRPYYQRYYAIYWLVIVVSWLANLLSAVTESSKIYAFYYPFLQDFSFAPLATWSSVIFSVILLEILHRLLASSYFKDLVENDLHTRDMTPKLAAMLILALISVGLSFTGSFDLIRLTTHAPTPLVAEKIAIEDLNHAYQPLVQDLQNDITDYRSTRQWQGRLSDKSAKLWEKMKTNKQQLQLEQAEALKQLSSVNLQTQIRTDSLNTARQQKHESEIDQTGFGLGFISVIAILVLYACLWYDEEYQERKAIYLEKKFGVMNAPLPISPVNSSQKVQNSVRTPILPTASNSHPNGQKNGTTEPRNARGFFRATQKQKMTSPSPTPAITSGQAWTELDRDILVQESDRYTVEHRYTKNGQTKIVHYTERMVNSRIAQYEREVEDAQTRQLAEAVIQNRQNWLIYWREKQQELYSKKGNYRKSSL